jgi:hypothetical protein
MRAAALIVLAATVAAADPAPDPAADSASAAYRAAVKLAVAAQTPAERGAAIDALEAIGAARPVSRWTDDAWAEAGRQAERAGDWTRARADLGKALDVATSVHADPALADDAFERRTRAELARIDAITAGGAWDKLAAEHERLVNALAAERGDPKPWIRQLEDLARANPGYPRVWAVRIAAARGRERDGDADLGIATLREGIAAQPAEPWQRIALVHVLVRQLLLEDAIDATDAYAALPGSDAQIAGELRDQIELASHRRWIRRALWAVLALVCAIGIFALRRQARSWAGAARALARPPLEVVLVAPIVAIVVVLGVRGNPLVARAVCTIALGGGALAWISGAVIVARKRRGAMRAGWVVTHAALAAVAGASLVYLALDRDRLIDLVEETLRSGPAMP